MTNEQREAIDRLNKDKNKPLACGDIIICFIDDLDTVLSLIKEQEKRIKDGDNITTEMNADIMKLIYMLKQKDKQIDLMANFISNYHCFELIVYDLDEECTHEHECKDCIKQYFETKAKKGE